MRRIILFLCLSVSAHADYEPEKYELAWQVMHLIDIGQTASAGSDPRYVEDSKHNFFLLDDHPSEESVYWWGLSSAIAHYFAFKWLDNNTEWGPALRRVEFGYKLGVIANNHSIGVRIRF